MTQIEMSNHRPAVARLRARQDSLFRIYHQTDPPQYFIKDSGEVETLLQDKVDILASRLNQFLQIQRRENIVQYVFVVYGGHVVVVALITLAIFLFFVAMAKGGFSSEEEEAGGITITITYMQCVVGVVCCFLGAMVCMGATYWCKKREEERIDGELRRFVQGAYGGEVQSDWAVYGMCVVYEREQVGSRTRVFSGSLGDDGIRSSDRIVVYGVYDLVVSVVRLR